MNLEMIIAFEGTDGSGKGTQAKMLQKYFEESGKNAVILDFPQYSTPTGKKIKEYLSGEKKLSPIEIAKLFYDDQSAQKDKINELVKNGTIIILDRYTLSTQAYQGAAAKTLEEKKEIIGTISSWQENLPRINAGIFFDLPVGYSSKKVIERGREMDIHEKNLEYLKKVHSVYMELYKSMGYERNDCLKNGKQKSREEIFSEILKIIREKTGQAF